MRLPAESAQFIGQTFSQRPQAAQREASIFIPKGAICEANPKTTPAGHQSQNRLPLAQANTAITANMTAAFGSVPGTESKDEKFIRAKTRPKFDIGSMTEKSGILSVIAPAAAKTAAAYRSLHGLTYFLPAIPKRPETRHKSS
jgi:hypothetical protein